MIIAKKAEHTALLVAGEAPMEGALRVASIARLLDEELEDSAVAHESSALDEKLVPAATEAPNSTLEQRAQPQTQEAPRLDRLAAQEAQRVELRSQEASATGAVDEAGAT